VDSSGNVYVGGHSTASWGSPVRAYSSGDDAFVVKLVPTAPHITVSPLSLAFGSQDVDAGATISQTVVITNEGTADLTISSLVITGTDFSQFSIETDTGEGTLTPGSTRTVQVSFDPSTTGAKSADLRIVSDDSDEGTVDVALSGTGTVIVLAADLIDKQVTSATAVPGETLTYTIAVTYPGSSLLSNATVTDTVPAGTTYVPASANAGGSESGGLITWNLGSNTLGFAGSSQAAMCPVSLTLTADADTWIYAKSGTWIYARSGKESLNYGADTLVRTASKSGEEQYGLIHFNVTSSTLPAEAVLQGAVLRITNDNSNSNRTVEVRELLTAWTEGTQNDNTCTSGATWNAPNCSDNWAGGGVFSSADYGASIYATLRPADNDLAHAVDLTPLAQSWVTGGTNNGVLLRANGSDTGEIGWYPRQEATTSYRPQLTLNYLVPTPSGCSGSETLNPLADTYIREDSPTENFERGTGERIHIRPESSKQRISLVRFDLSSIPLGATINSATIGFNVQNTGSGFNANVHRLLTAWDEGAATWNDSNGTATGDWASSGGVFGSNDYAATVEGTVSLAAGGFQTASVTGLVRDWVENGLPNYGLALIGSAAATDRAELYHSEDSDPLNHPYIQISWTLPPGTGTGTTLSTDSTLVTAGKPITVTMVLTASQDTPNVSPSAPTITATNGVSASLVSGPTPASATVGFTGTTFSWVYQTSDGGNVGQLTFGGEATNGSTTWAWAQSNSVIVAPPLSFRVTVDDPAPVSRVSNVA
jgi:uncharacterized repeat protein (TIGR01451 family)